MCDILDTISLNTLFQLRLHGQWEPYKGIWVKSLNLDQMLGYLEQENVVFGLTPCPCLVWIINFFLQIRLDGSPNTIPRIHIRWHFSIQISSLQTIFQKTTNYS